MRQVPRGRVTTYGALATALGAPTWARQTGWALAALGRSLDVEEDEVPAHRVINASGRPSPGFAFGAPEIQRQLLEDEGVQFDASGRVLDRFFWEP